jgi:hypothetical protein
MAAIGLIDRLSALAISDPRSPLHEAEPEAISVATDSSSTKTVAQTGSSTSFDDGN